MFIHFFIVSQNIFQQNQYSPEAVISKTADGMQIVKDLRDWFATLIKLEEENARKLSSHFKALPGAGIGKFFTLSFRFKMNDLLYCFIYLVLFSKWNFQV